MEQNSIPKVFRQMMSEGCIGETDIRKTGDGFWMIDKSVADLLAQKGILDFPDKDGVRIPCDRFYDDWFLFAVPDGDGHTYSLLKLREQEHDAEDGAPADGDTPGVTVSFVSFACEILLECLLMPADRNRRKLDVEINRVVAYGGQHHHKALKRYFADPRSQGAYLVADLYTKHMASFAENGKLELPRAYQQIVQRSISFKNSARLARLPRFIASVNEKAGRVVCDEKYLYIKDRENPDAYECAAILATHTGNTSPYSFAAEVEYHAGYLVAIAKIKLPFFSRSVYSSAIRADMTIGDEEGVIAVDVDVTDHENGISYEENMCSPHHIAADTVVLAIGQGPSAMLSEKAQIATTLRGLFVVDENGMTNIPGVFAAGDVVSGPKTVVEAVAHTKKVAEHIIGYCNDKRSKENHGEKTTKVCR